MNIAASALMGRDGRCARQGEVARTGKDAVFGDGVLWRTGRCAGDEGVPSQDAALVFQGVLSGAVGRADCPAGGWWIPADAMKYCAK